jgi:hypothetical protein
MTSESDEAQIVPLAPLARHPQGQEPQRQTGHEQGYPYVDVDPEHRDLMNQ